MSTFGAKSSNGRTNWLLIDGRLKEIGPDSPAFTLSATDTLIILKLLRQGVNEIISQANREAGISSSPDTLAVDLRDDSMPSESGRKTGQTSSIEIDAGLKGGNPFQTMIDPKNAERGA